MMPKDRLISESRFVEDLYGCLDGCDFELEDVLNVLKGVESVDAVPVVHGHWKCGCGGSYNGTLQVDLWGCSWNCSNCGESCEYKPKYCPCCGAKMDGEQKDGINNES